MPKNDLMRKMQSIYKNGYIDGARDMEQTTIDYVYIALGRLGYGETRLCRLKEKLDEVWKDYGDLFKSDRADNDKEYVYAIEMVDRELKQYCGEHFKSWDERHGNGRSLILCKIQGEQAE